MNTTVSVSQAPSKWNKISLLKVLVFFLCLVPIANTVYAVVTGTSGPNPIEFITHNTGEWALRFILFGLTLTPMRWVLKSAIPIRFRRMIGLFAFFYVVVHFATYAVLDQQLDLSAITEDIFKRTYIIAGFVSLVVLIPLAATSTKGMMRRLGKRWFMLHKSVYIASIAAVLHYIWLAKGDQIEPLIYAAVLVFLLGWRLQRKYKASKPK